MNALPTGGLQENALTTGGLQENFSDKQNQEHNENNLPGKMLTLKHQGNTFSKNIIQLSLINNNLQAAHLINLQQI